MDVSVPHENWRSLNLLYKGAPSLTFESIHSLTHLDQNEARHPRLLRSHRARPERLRLPPQRRPAQGRQRRRRASHSSCKSSYQPNKLELTI